MQIINLGYRLRWLYLLLCLALAWWWWAVYLERYLVPRGRAHNASLLHLTRAYWTGQQGDVSFGYLGGAFGIDPTSAYGWGRTDPLWLSSFALALVLLWLALVPLYLGLRGRTRQRWTVRTPLHAGAILATAVMAGMLSTGAVSLALMLWDPLLWGRFIYLPLNWPGIEALIMRGQRRPPWWAGSITPLTLTILLIGAWVVALRWRGRDLAAYWRLVRVTRWLAIAAITLWLARWAVPYLRPAPPPPWPFGAWAMHSALHTASFAATSVLVWVAAVRTWLLFRYRAFEQAETEPVCFACGYDLRGSIPAGSTHCPECGMKISPSTVAAVQRQTPPQATQA